MLVKARVLVTLDVDCLSTWSPGHRIDQVVGEARHEVLDTVAKVITSKPRMRIIGTRVKMFLIEEEEDA